MPDMDASGPYALLILNAGSSSIKFGVYEAASLAPLLTGSIKALSRDHPHLSFTDHSQAVSAQRSQAWEGGQTTTRLMQWLGQWMADHGIGLTAVAHRIVWAMQHAAPVIISQDLLRELKYNGKTDPEHASITNELIDACIAQFADISQVALFDSAFHSRLPATARILPVPQRYRDMGLQRYGFHGLSYASIMAQLKASYGQKVHDSKVIIAHLGNGSSLAAIHGGISIDTTMSFSPTGGIPMSTRSGDLDPSVVLRMLHTGSAGLDEMASVLNNDSGLKAVSGTTGDISQLLKKEATDPSAKAAIGYFCYHVRKAIGSYVAALGGLDVLVFTGGIGEHLPDIRRRICEGLSCMGILMDQDKNLSGAQEIAADGSPVLMLALPSQEEVTMAKLLHDFIIDQTK